MRWQILALIAILSLTPPVASGQQPAQPTCEVSCIVNPSNAPAECNCNASITTGSGGTTPNSGGDGDLTPAILFDQMVAAWEAEIAQVENYILIEKSKAAPLPDIRYYERKSSGAGAGGDEEGFVWIPNQELARRELVANPSHGSGNSRTEIPPEVANDPTLFVNALGDALEILGQFAGAGELGAALGKAADEEAEKIRGNAQEAREGIEGADTLGGMLSERHRDVFRYISRFSFARPWGTFILATNEFIEIPYQQFYSSDMEPFYDAWNGTGEWPSTSYVCQINKLDSSEKPLIAYEEPEWWEDGQEYPPAKSLPFGSKIQRGESWYCRVEGKLKPMRISLMYLDPNFMRMTIQEENTQFVRRGPALIPRRIQRRILQGEQFFVDEVERVIMVNEGLLTQARLAELVGESMDWSTFYQAQGVP